MISYPAKKLRDEEHDDSNWITGFILWSFMDNFKDVNSFDEYLVNFDKKDDWSKYKEIIFKITKIIMITHVIEHRLISKIEMIYNSSPNDQQEKIQKDIIDKTKRTNKIKREDAIDLIKKQQDSRSDVWIVPPILQYVAGYTLGDLVYLYGLQVKNDNKLLVLLKEFKEKRNTIIHNTTSSRINIKNEINDALKLIDSIFAIFDNVDNKKI